MGYELQDPDKTNQIIAPVTTPEEEKKKAPPAGADLVPAENKTAKEDKDKGKPAKEEVTEKEAARRKAVAEKWEDSLGKWLGAPLAKLVLEHVSLDSLNSYVQEGLKAAGPALGDALKGATNPSADQEAGLKAYSAALSGVMTGLVEKWVASPGGQKAMKAISNFVQGHPGWTMTIVGAALIGGAIGAWFSNADLSSIEIPLGLPKGWELKLGLDLGTIQNLGFHGAAIAVANKSQGFSFEAKGEKKEKETDKDDGAGGKIVETTTKGSASVTLGKDKEPKFTFGVNGSIVDNGEGLVIHSTGAKIELVDPINGVKITIDETGKWDTKGNKDNTFSYTAKAGKDDGLNGSFNFTEKNATVVDANGNIVDISSREIGVAVGAKGLKFSASSKTEEKDGEEKTTSKANVSGGGQLTKGLSFKGDAGVTVTDDVVTMKIGAGITAQVGEKTIELAGNYESDGPVTGRVKIGTKDDYIEVTGEKKGDVITFKTKDVFPGGSHTKESSKDQKTGAITEKETVSADVGKGQTLNVATGTAGSTVGYTGKGLGGTPLNVNTGLNFNPAGQLNGGSLGLGYSTEMLKLKLDMEMLEAKTKFGASVDVKTPQGFKFDANINVDDGILKSFGTSAGYSNPDQTKSFLLGYKRTWLDANKGHEDKFDAMLSYSMGRFATRFSGDATLQGGQLKSMNADLGLSYGLDKQRNWTGIAGVTAAGTFNDPGKANSMAISPYVGLGNKQSNTALLFHVNPMDKTKPTFSLSLTKFF